MRPTTTLHEEIINDTDEVDEDNEQVHDEEDKETA
jgi:hypothetical protein